MVKRLSRTFELLLGASAVSNFGDGLRVAALPLLAADVTRDPLQIAAVTAAIWLPWLAFGLYGGAIADRMDQPSLLLNVQIARLLVSAILVILVALDRASMPAIYAAAFAIGMGEVITEPVMQALVPRLVANDHLERANSNLLAAEMAGNELVGPPIGGFLFAVSPAIPFAVDAASYGCSAAVAQRLKRRLPSVEHTRAPLRQITSEVIQGVRWLSGHSYLRAVTIWGGFFNLGSSAYYSVLVLFALDVLRTTETGYGLLVSSLAAGGLLGTVIASPLAKRLGRGRAILLASTTSGLAASAVGLTSNAYLAGCLMFLGGGAGIVVNVIGRALRQSLVPTELLGRVTSSGRIVVYGAIPLGSALGGWLGNSFGLRAPYVVGGLIMAAASLALGPWLRESVIQAAQANRLRRTD